MMKVLVATHVGQGEQDRDYCWTLDGELVSPLVIECRDSDRCGCRRGFPGFASGRATTTAMVVDLPHIGEDELTVAATDYMEQQGLLEDRCPFHREEAIEALVGAIIDVGEAFPVGTVVRRDGDDVFTTWRRAA